MTIRGGRKKAIDWLEDKLTGSPFALPAIYQPRPNIPLDHWLPANYTANRIEQKPADLNRDGKQLLLLSGIMLGYQYDTRALQVQSISTAFLMWPRYQEATTSARLQLAVHRQGESEKKRAISAARTGLSPQKKKARTRGRQRASLEAHRGQNQPNLTVSRRHHCRHRPSR